MDDSRGATVQVEIEGRRLRLSNLDKVLWPTVGFTKGEMIDYYVRVAPVLLPHVSGRPLTLRRFPDGVHGLAWFQTRCTGRPSWLPTRPIRDRTGEIQHYCLVNDLPSLVWVANLATIELHPFLARGDRLDRPAVVAFDLDPGAPAGLVDCCRVAMWIREKLEGLGLSSLLKTSGSKGLQVYVPLNTPHSYQQTKAFARAVARALSEEHPTSIVERMQKSLRAGKVLIDWSQNDQTKSTVAPYSLRARPEPTVSTPVSWDEVEATVARGDRELLVFRVPDVLDRVDRFGDLFRPVLERTQSLPR